MRFKVSIELKLSSSIQILFKSCALNSGVMKMICVASIPEPRRMSAYLCSRLFVDRCSKRPRRCSTLHRLVRYRLSGAGRDRLCRQLRATCYDERSVDLFGHGGRYFVLVRNHR